MGHGYRILAINPGSTSMRIAVYEDTTLLFEDKIDLDPEELSTFASNVAQFPLRRTALDNCLKEHGFDCGTLAAIAARGGKFPPVRQGAYVVDESMVDFLTHRPVDDHASNLGALLAYDIARPLGITSYIYDAVVMDQMEDVARLSGLPEIRRKASCHALNMRAMGRKAADEHGLDFNACTMLVTHMGAGISATVIRQGCMIDVLSDEEGPYSPERSGGLPNRQLIDLCYAGGHDHLAATKRTRGLGGLMAYLGTNNALEVERRIKAGDAKAKHVYEGMCYQVAKGLGGLATVVGGAVDLVVLTGALAHSQFVTKCVAERVAFIAPVCILPGENELEALAFGVLRVLREEEAPHQFREMT